MKAESNTGISRPNAEVAEAPGNTASFISLPPPKERSLVLLYNPNSLFHDCLMESGDPEWLEIRRIADPALFLQTVQRGHIHAVILCTSTGDSSGLDLLKRIRSSPDIDDTPVMMLTEGADYERIVSLELGADDCLLAPFLSREVWLRIRSLLRRSNYLNKPAGIDTPELYFAPDSRLVRILNKPVHLTETEFRLLSLLLRRPDTVVEKQDLIDVLSRSSGPMLDYRTINTHMRRLRRKLGPIGKELKNIRSVGYKLAWRPGSAIPPR